jgi:hypothetical protein
METMMDPATLTVEEVVGHLRAVEERLDAEQGHLDPAGQLLMTEKQWEERKKQSRNSGAGGSGGSRDGSGAKKGGQAQPRNTPTAGAAGETDREKCRYYGKKGYWARECRKKQRDEAAAAAANLTQKEDDGEDGLYMATVVVELADSEATDAALAITATPDSPSSASLPQQGTCACQAPPRTA